jgi:hypothetical protein
MSVDWGDYESFDPGVSVPLHELPKREAKAAFDRLMAAKDARIDALRGLLKRNGIELGTSDDALQDLNDWFRSEVEADPNNAGRLRPIWYSVVNDIALFLGDLIIERAPNIRWTFFDKGTKDVSFQRHVLTGFAKVKNPKYNVDIDRLVATYGHRIIAGEEVEEDDFWRWVKAAESKG